MKKFIFLACFYSLVASAQSSNLNGNSLQLNTITTAVPFAIVSTDAMATGVGDAGLGLAPTANSLFWNSASLGFTKEKGEVNLNYSPWFRKLVSDLNLFEGSGYAVLGAKGRHVLGGSFKFFSLGEIPLTDNLGNIVAIAKPKELEMLVGYAFRISERSSIGINAKYIRSNLLAGVTLNSINPGQSVAADISYTFKSSEFCIGKMYSHWNWGVTLSNLGNKMSYTWGGGDFLPANMRLGASITTNFNNKHKGTFLLNFNKLLVPTPPVYNNGVIVAGLDPNVSAARGWIQSFYDAPGNVSFDQNGNTVIEEGSPLQEEFNEVNFSVGFDYVFRDFLSVRCGYFYEPFSKGNRRYVTFGLGFSFYNVRLNSSFLLSTASNSPLANTMRFGAAYVFPTKERSSTVN